VAWLVSRRLPIKGELEVDRLLFRARGVQINMFDDLRFHHFKRCRRGVLSKVDLDYRSARLTLWRGIMTGVGSGAYRQYGRYGYRKVAALLRQAGWTINDKRVERIWQREGLKVPHKQPKRGRLWLVDGSCIRLRPEHRNHVWSYDFVEDRTHDGR